MANNNQTGLAQILSIIGKISAIEFADKKLSKIKGKYASKE